MDKRTKLLIYGAAAYMVLSMMAMIIKSRKRKRVQGENSLAMDYGTEEDGYVSGASGADATNDENGATSLATKPKRAKTTASEEDEMQATFKYVGERLALAIENAGIADNELPDDLFESVHSIPGFDDAHLSHYHAYLVENPRSARAFCSLPSTHKRTWVARYVSTTFDRWSCLHDVCW